MQRILTVEQMRYAEKRSDELGVSLEKLMDNAGEALARNVLKQCLKQGLHSCLILAGKGNNGGDGFVAANFLAASGVKVTVLLCCSQPGTALSANAFSRLDKSIIVTEDTCIAFEGFEVIVDCVFGTGFHGQLSSEIKAVFQKANACGCVRVACDIPSGCNAGNGQADPDSFKADITVTFHRIKFGMLLSPARYFCAKTVTADIGIPQQTDSETSFPITLCDKTFASSFLPERVPYGHKGTFGRLSAVCGSRRYIGAAKMSVHAALRTGVGLCELCTAERVIDCVCPTLPECIFTGLPTDSDGFVTQSSSQSIIQKTRSSQCLLIGCGLGHTPGTEKLVAELVQNSDCPLVIDADGINSLAANIDVLQKKKSDVILTPHPKELSRLCGCELSQVISDPLGCARQIAEKYDVTVLAKGSESFAVNKQGCIVIRSGNTALSKGGSGDVLAGITASLIAQGCAPINACTAASFILGSAAEMLCKSSSPRGLLASDIISALPAVLRILEQQSE